MSTLTVGTISEKVTDAGVAVDGVTLKDGGATFTSAVGVTGNTTITSGNLVIGTSGNGIDFSATSNSSGTMSSELLDDYEEGTFTPNVADDTSGGNSASVSSVMGDYTKVGNLVYVNIVIVNINTSGMTSSNALFVTGLPFVSKTRTSPANISQHLVVRGDQINVASDCYGLIAVVTSGGTHLQFNQNRDNVPDSFTTVAGIASASADMFISGCYIAD